MNSAEVLVKFKGNTEDLEKKSDKAKSVLKGFAGGMSVAFGVAAGAVASATSAVAELVKQSVNAYAEFEQLEGGLVSLFGEGSTEMNKILQDSENAWKNLTMSQNDYLTSFQSAYPLVNSGLSENADGIEYTNKMLQLSSDLFNTYGGSIDYYQNAINWALKGSFVYLDNLNLGIKGTQEGFIEAANNSGILGRQIQNVSELTSDEIIDVIQHYAEAYGVWGKTGQEAGTTILGSLNMVKATWQNFITGLSKSDADINKLIDNLVNSVITFAGNVVPVIIRAIESITTALPKVVQSLADMIPGLLESILPNLINAAINLVKSIAQNLPDIIKILMKALLQALEGILTLLPDIINALLQGITAIIQALAEALPTLMPTLITSIIDSLLAILDNIDVIIDAGLQLLMGLTDGIIAALPILIERLPEIIQKILMVLAENLPKLLEAGIQILIALQEGIIQCIPTFIEAIPKIIMAFIEAAKVYYPKLISLGLNLLKKLVEGLGSGLSAIWDVGKNLVHGLWNGINNAKDWVIGKIQGMGESILSAIKGIFGIHSPSTEFEFIGRMNMVGFENGMENMKSQVQRTIDSVFNLQPDINGSMSNSFSPEFNVQVINNLETDPLGQLVNNVKTFSGGAKNDYNWGAGL